MKVKNKRGDTARSLAMLNGNMNVVALIDNINVTASTLRSEPGKYQTNNLKIKGKPPLYDGLHVE